MLSFFPFLMLAHDGIAMRMIRILQLDGHVPDFLLRQCVFDILQEALAILERCALVYDYMAR